MVALAHPSDRSALPSVLVTMSTGQLGKDELCLQVPSYPQSKEAKSQSRKTKKGGGSGRQGATSVWVKNKWGGCKGTPTLRAPEGI